MRTHTRTGLVLVAVSAVGECFAPRPTAQAPRATSPLTFDVASVKPNRLDDRIVSISVGPGARFTARGYTLVLLMQRAWGVMDWNVTGGPAWIRTDRFDVLATSSLAQSLTEAQLQPMLQAMLTERFKLTVHKGTKEMDGYALAVDRNGLKVRPAADGEGDRDSFRWTNAGLTARGISMTDFARFVSGKLGLVGLDKTGLAGFYDFDAKWTGPAPDQTAGILPVDPRDALRAAVFDALQDQLGLKMEPSRGPVEVLAIDRVEQPTPD